MQQGNSQGIPREQPSLKSYEYAGCAKSARGRRPLGARPKDRVEYCVSPLSEAAGAAACLITDAWTGVEHFFEPGSEILVAHGADDIVRYLREISPAKAHQIGSAMHERALRDHVYESRAKLVDEILQSAPTKAPLAESAA
jgi:hypothetical protein